MIFSLDVRRARKGDCLLLHCGSPDKPGLIMIDGGPRGVYKPHLKPRLMQIKAARQLDRHTPLTVDLLMVSHLDDDHIQGLLDLTAELLGAVPPAMLRVKRLWHNSFDDIIGNTPAELSAAVAAGFGPASLNGELPDDAGVESDEPEEVVRASLQVLASIEQGHRLRGNAMKLGFSPNDKLIVADSKALPVVEGLEFIVAGPMRPELQALQKKHDEWLRAQKKKKKEGVEALAAYVDRSVPNLSSMVVLARSKGKSMLLTGDARGDKIIEGLEMVGALKPEQTMHVDVLKVPHHGSSNNLTRKFFSRITADHYVFSGNGEHGNPERRSMEMLLEARDDEEFVVHLTYPVADIDKAREEDWKKGQDKERKKKTPGVSKKEPREDWSHEKHSLAAFFKKRNFAGDQLRIVDKEQPHLIELLLPLGY